MFRVNVFGGLGSPSIDMGVCGEGCKWMNRGAGCYPIGSDHMAEEKR
jgi:hypothetical protein